MKARQAPSRASPFNGAIVLPDSRIVMTRTNKRGNSTKIAFQTNDFERSNTITQIIQFDTELNATATAKHKQAQTTMSRSTLNPPKTVPKRAEVIADDDTMKEAIQRLDTRTFGLFHRTTLHFAIQEGQEENLADLTKRMLDKNGIEEEETEIQGIMKFNPFEDALEFTLETGTYRYYGIKWKRN